MEHISTEDQHFKFRNFFLHDRDAKFFGLGENREGIGSYDQRAYAF
jgi:hypothetical protein